MDLADAQTHFLEITPVESDYSFQKVPNYGDVGKVELTWRGLNDDLQVENTASSETDIKITKGPLTLVTKENKSNLPPEFEEGDVIYSVEVADSDGFKSAVYISIGKDWVIGKESKNTIDESFFEGEDSTKIFREGDFNNKVAVPIYTLFKFLKDTYGFDGPTTFYIADLPEGIQGRTYSNNNDCSTSNLDTKMVLDVYGVINPLNRSVTFSQDRLSLFDEVVFETTAHEAFHSLMAQYGIPRNSNMRIGAEAAANAFGLTALSIMRFFNSGPAFEDANSAYNQFIRSKAYDLFANHNIDMSTTGKADSGYEHFTLVYYLMTVTNMSWRDIFNTLRDYKFYCDRFSNSSPTLFQNVFNKQLVDSDEGPHPFPYTYLIYLGFMLQKEGSYLPEIFDAPRRAFAESKKYPLGYGTKIQIAPKNFIPFTLDTPGLSNEDFLAFEGDEGMYAVASLTNGQILVLTPGSVLPDRSKFSKDIIVYNSGSDVFTFLLKRYSNPSPTHNLNIPLVKG